LKPASRARWITGLTVGQVTYTVMSDDMEADMSVAEVARLLGGPKVLGRRITSQLKMAEAVDEGLPPISLDRIKRALELSDVELAHAIGISPKTIHRLRTGSSRHLSSATSDRLYRIARIFLLATEVLEDDDGAREWLRSPQLGLADRTPLALMTTEAGSREVEALLLRIEHGVIA
jgi:putative toxin-antitoxin system antitoxin component (TIGR02293 family)